jgi:hypothetical protein
MRSLKAILGLAVMAFILAGCGGGSGSSSSAAGVSTSGGSSGSGSSGSGSGSSGTGTGTAPTAKSATLAWTAPTTNTNGSALTNLAGYYIYYGNTAGSMTNKVTLSSAAMLTYVISNLSTGTWYFGIVAYTNGGLQSSMSNVGSKTIT